MVFKKEEKSLVGGKKRGRKFKERFFEEFAFKMFFRRDDWFFGGRDKGVRGFIVRKVGVSKLFEK